MRKSITESSVLFISIIKWVFLATVAGIIVGGATAFFLKLLQWSIEYSHRWEYSFWLLPIAMFLSTLLIKYLAPEAEGHGTEKVIEAIHKRSGKIAAPVVPVKLVATIITLAVGGSVGKEGPCAQIGAGLTSLLSDIFRFDEHDRKKLVICGISAGFAAVFGTPIAGAIFGVEVLFVGAILYEVLLPSFISGIIAYHVSSMIGITYFHEPVSVVPVFSEVFFLKILGAGIFFGLCAILLIETVKYGERLSKKLTMWAPLKGLIGGALLIVFTYVFSQKYLGLGLTSIESSFRGEQMEWYAFIVKPIFTSITLGFGGSGGIVTPIFFVGASAGNVFAQLFNLNIATFSAIGFVAVLAGAANTPIAASIMALEIFGPAIGPYATIACVISFLMTGHRSVYPSQILSISKSQSLQVELGGEIEDMKTTLILREKGFMSRVLWLIKKIEKTVHKIQRGSTSSDDPDNNTPPMEKK
jgi:H+/Cl- antiporter ClcA